MAPTFFDGRTANAPPASAAERARRPAVIAASADWPERHPVLPVGDLLTERRPLDVGGAEVDAAPDARVDDLLERVGEAVEVLGVGDLLLEMVKAILSVPKKSRSVWTMALLAHP